MGFLSLWPKMHWRQWQFYTIALSRSTINRVNPHRL
jgi:hypothetical protein